MRHLTLHSIWESFFLVIIESADYLYHFLFDDTDTVIRKALLHYDNNTILSLEENPVPYLIEFLDDDNPTVRSRSATLLGIIGDYSAVMPLINHVDDSFSTGEIIRALAQFRDKRAVNALQEGYNHYDPQVRQIAENALRQMGVSPKEKLTPTPSSDSFAHNVSAEYDDVLVEELIERLGSQQSSERTDAMESLVVLGKLAVPSIIEALNHKDEGIRARSASLLGIIKDERAVIPLINILDDPSNDVRINAIHSLKEIGFASVSPLIVALTRRKMTVQIYAAWALGEIGDERAIKPLIRHLYSNDDELRLECIRALGKIGNTSAISYLLSLLKNNTNKEEESEICLALAEIGDERTISVLNKIAKTETDPQVKKCARYALAVITTHMLFGM